MMNHPSRPMLRDPEEVKRLRETTKRYTDPVLLRLHRGRTIGATHMKIETVDFFADHPACPGLLIREGGR